MTATHRIYLIILGLMIVLAVAIVTSKGFGYYTTPLEERFFHAEHNVLKPGGTWGHGLGIAGSLAMLIGVSSYMIRKRSRRLARWWKLKHWLEFHIFLCTLGPALVLFHTSFKFGGIVAVSFWSMVAVFLSGIIGRFIYIQIPRSIEGRELTAQEIGEMRTNLIQQIAAETPESFHGVQKISVVSDLQQRKESAKSFPGFFSSYRRNKLIIMELKTEMALSGIKADTMRKIIGLVKKELKLSRRIERLDGMQRLFRYWHVAHLPFAIVMLIIMIVHVVVTILFGYRWIF